MSTKTESTTGAPIDQEAMADSIQRAFAFARAEFTDPSILANVPNGASLVLIPDDDPAAATRAIRAGVTAVERGKNVFFLHILQGEDGALTINRNGTSA